MYLLFLPLSFLIPSASGLATVAMPIMAPLATFADVPPQPLVVTAYQSGNGLLNLITPTSAVVMGGLGDRARRVRPVPPVGLAAPRDAGRGHRAGADRRRGDVVRGDP